MPAAAPCSLDCRPARSRCCGVSSTPASCLPIRIPEGPGNYRGRARRRCCAPGHYSTTWLAEDQDKLRLLESLQRSAEEWDEGEPARRSADPPQRPLAGCRGPAAESALSRWPKRRSKGPIWMPVARRNGTVKLPRRRSRSGAFAMLSRLPKSRKRRPVAQKKIAQRTRIGLAVAVVLMIAAAIAGWIAIGQKQSAELVGTSCRGPTVDR